MANTSRKPASKPVLVSPKTKSKRQARPGRDGRTLGDRLALAMAYEAGRRHGEYRQADLVADVNALAKASIDDPILTQQMLSAVMLNKVTRSTLTPLLAAACHVNPLWLSDGVGEMFL